MQSANGREVQQGIAYVSPKVQRVQPTIKASRRERPSRSRALARQRQLQVSLAVIPISLQITLPDDAFHHRCPKQHVMR